MTESEADIFAYILRKNVDLEIPDGDGLPLIVLLDRQEFTLAQMLVDKIKDDARRQNISEEELQAILSLKKYSQDVFAHLEFFIRNGYTETYVNHENIPMVSRTNPDLQILYYELHPDEINWLNDNGRNILFYNPSEKLLYYLLQNGIDYNGNNLLDYYLNDTKYKYIILALIDLGVKPNNPERIEWIKYHEAFKLHDILMKINEKEDLREVRFFRKIYEKDIKMWAPLTYRRLQLETLPNIQELPDELRGMIFSFI